MAPSPARAANCGICGSTRAQHLRLGTQAALSLCPKCQAALSPLSEAEAARLATYVATHPVPTPPEKTVARVTTSSPTQVERQLTDPRVPAPETILVYKQLGYTSQEIADMFAISLAQTRRLITAGHRGTLADSARDYIAQQFIPKVLANIDAALQDDKSARLSVEIADKLGLLSESAASRPPSGDEVTETFESYRLSILKRRVTPAPASETLDATSVRTVSNEVPPADAEFSESGSTSGRLTDGAVDGPAN